MRLGYHKQFILASVISASLGIVSMCYFTYSQIVDYSYRSYLNVLPKHVNNVSQLLVSTVLSRIQSSIVPRVRSEHKQLQFSEVKESRTTLRSVPQQDVTIPCTLTGFQYIQDPTIWMFDLQGRMVNIPLGLFYPEYSGVLQQLYTYGYYVQWKQKQSISRSEDSIVLYVLREQDSIRYVQELEIPIIDEQIVQILEQQKLNSNSYFFMFSKNTGTLLVQVSYLM